MKKAILSMVFVVLYATCAVADAWFSWQKDGFDNPSGNIGDPDHWNKDLSLSTLASDYLQFALENTDYTVTVPNGTTHETMMRPFITARNGYVTTFDGENAVWLQPVSTKGNYSATRVQFRLVADGINNNDIWRLDCSASTDGGFRMSDFLFKVYGTLAPDYLVDFSRGTYNFTNPNGTTLSTYFYICGANGDSARDTTVRFSGTSSFSVPKVRFGNGGWHRTLDITGGATGTIGTDGFELYGADTKGGMSAIRVHDGGTLTMDGKLKLIASHTFRLLIEDGATFSVPASKTFNFGSAAGQDAYDGLMVVSNATLSGGTGSIFQPYAKTYFDKATVTIPTFSPYAKTVLVDSQVDLPTFFPYAETIVSNSQVNVTTLKGGGTANVSFEDGSVVNTGTMLGGNAVGDTCTYLFKDSTVTSSTDDVRYETTIVIDGGRYVSTSTCKFNYSGSGATLVLTNGGEYVFTANADMHFAQSASGSTSLLVRGGKLTANTSSKDIRWGENGGSGTGRVELASGEIAVGNRSAIVGKGGYGRQMEMLVSGGKYSGGSLYFTSAGNSADKVSYLRQTGGEIELSGGFHAVTNYPGRTLLSLEGGTFKATQIFGGLGATASGGAGYAMLEADGGTIVAGPSPFAAGFIRGLDSAVIGDGGLTVDAAYDVLIPQAFADKDGENGELILTGSAVKMLSGSSTVSKIVAAGGRTVFADGQATTSTLVVTNGAEVAFASASAGASLSGVTFGDASSVGVLVATPGVVPVINGTVDVANIKVALASGFANYTTNAVLSANSFTEGSAIALAKALVVSGLPAGAAASFMIEEVDGRQVLKMALTDTPTLVIRVDEGTSNITSAVTYPISGLLQTIVAEGASLDISGAVGYGALENSGDGKVTLSNQDNRFAGDIVSSSGTFSVEGLAALSPYDALTGDMFTLSGGTLELADEASPAVFPRNLRTDAGSSADAVVIKTDTDVTIADATGFALSGAVIKRGAGTLKVTTAQSGLPLAAGQGPAGNNKYPATSNILSFGTDGKPSGTYWSAMSVVEGGLTLEGTSENSSFTIPDITTVGIPCLTGTVVPSLTVRDATLSATWLLLGCGLASTNTFITSAPTFYATNSAVTLNTFAASYNSTYSSVKPHMTLDASSMTLNFLFRANNAAQNNGVEAEYSLVNGSTLTTPRIGLSQKASFECDASTIDVTELFCKTASYANQSGYVFPDSYAFFTFRNGSRFLSDYIEPSRGSTATAPLTFEFDDSEWSPKPGQNADYVFAFTNAFNLLLKAGAGGLILAPGEGLTWSVVHPVTGADGKIIKRGAGTLAFTGNGALAVGGVNEVESGVFAVAATSTVYGVKAHLAAGTTLDLLEGTHSGAVVSGTGNIRNGTLVDAVLSVAVDGDTEAPLLSFDDGLALANTLTFDLGRTTDNPVEVGARIVVCSYTGTPTANICYKISGTGISGSRTEFTVEGGTISVVVKPPRGVRLTFK